MSDLFTRLETAGGYAIIERASTVDRLKLSLHLAALRTAGHALAADEVMESGETTGTLRIIHYLSCVRCKNIPKPMIVKEK